MTPRRPANLHAVALPLLATLALLGGFARAESPRPATPDVGAGPNHRAGAPFRAKLSPPLAEGTPLVVKGHVRSAGGEPVPWAVLDAFHADHRGEYDMEGFDYRGRVLADEGGYFEFETIRPQSYGPPPHIHFIVSAEGFRTLRTEMQIDDGREVRRELTPALEERRAGERVWLEGTFDVVLEPAGAAGS